MRCNVISLDNDECAGNGGVGDCANGASCTNTEGSFTCNCAFGWTGGLCIDGESSLPRLSFTHFHVHPLLLKVFDCFL